jgi:hypothetical protein
MDKHDKALINYYEKAVDSQYQSLKRLERTKSPLEIMIEIHRLELGLEEIDYLRERLNEDNLIN